MYNNAGLPLLPAAGLGLAAFIFWPLAIFAVVAAALAIYRMVAKKPQPSA